MEMDSLRGELERLFNLNELMELSSSLLGFQPDIIGGTSSIAAYVRALTDYCDRRGAVEALCDAVASLRSDASSSLLTCRESGLSAPLELSPGDRLGDFLIERELAEGPRGACFVAHHNETEFRLKILHPESLRDARGAHRFLTFNRMLRSVGGPGLPEEPYIGREQGKVFIAHHLLPAGEPLSEKFAHGGPLSEPELHALGLSLSQALQSLHSAGLCHGNLKLENVIVGGGDGADGADLNIQLVDAGTDLLRSLKPSAGVLPVFSLSAPHTTAPERLRGATRSAESDIYAVGAMLYELSCGQPPFGGETSLDIALSELSSSPTPPIERADEGWISLAFSGLIVRLLHQDPEQRPRNGQALQEELELVVAGDKEAPTEEKFEQLREAFLATPQLEDANRALQAIATGEFRARVYRLFVQAGSATVKPDGAAATPDSAANSGGDSSPPSSQSEGGDRSDVSTSTMSAQLRHSLLMRGARGLRSCGLLDEAAAAFSIIVASDATDEAAWHGLDDCRLREGKFDEVVESLLGRLETAANSAERAQLMSRIGDLYAQQLDDRAQAAVAYTQAFCEKPRDATLIRHIESVAQADERIWSEVLSTCAEASSETDRPDEVRVPLLQQMGHWYVSRQPRPELALPCFQTVLRLTPEHEGAMTGIASVYRTNRMWTELSDLLIRQADASSTPSDARGLRAQAADVFETRLDDTDGAQRLYERILTDDPADLVVTKALGRIYEKNDEVERLLPLLERQVAEEQGASRHAALCRLAQLHREKVANLEKSRQYYQAVLEEEPTHAVARQGLHDTLAKAGQFKDLLSSLQLQLAQEDSPREKVRLLGEIAHIYEEEFLRHGDAVGALEKIVQLDPANRAALAGLARLYRVLERWDELAKTLTRQALMAEQENERADFLVSRARLMADQLGDLPGAIDCYEQIAQGDSSRMDAREAIADLQEALGDQTKAVQAITILAEASDNNPAKLRYCLRIAKLLESNTPSEECLSWYRKILVLDPGNERATASLRESYAQSGDQEGLLDLLRTELSRTDSDRSRGRLLMQIAALEKSERKDLNAARLAAEQSLQVDPSNPNARLFLGDTAYEQGHLAEAIPHYRALEDRLDTLSGSQPRQVVERLVECLHATQQNPGDGGLQYAEVLLGLNPGDPETLKSAADLSFRFGTPERSQQLLEELLASDALELDDAQRAQIEYQLGDSLRRLEQWDRAIACLEQASQRDPDSNFPLQSIAQLHRDRNNWTEVLRADNELLDHPSTENKHELLIEMGEISIEHLQQPERALSSFSAALQLAPDDRRVLRRLMQLYSEQENWSELVSVVEKLASFVDESQQKAKYLMTAAKVSARHLGAREKAIDIYQQVLALDPDHPKVLSECVVLQIETGDTAGAEEALLQQLSRAQDQDSIPLQLEMLDALFALYHRVPEKLEEAVQIVDKAQELSPEDPIHEDRLGELFEKNAARYADRAIPLNFGILQRKPDSEQAYRRLRQVYTETRQADPAWCLCQVLHLLKLSEPEETRFFERHRSPQAAPAQASLTLDDWNDALVHPMVDDRLTQIFAIIEPTMVASRGQSFEALGYDPQLAVDLRQHPYPLAQMLYYVASVMGMNPPPTFENHHEPGGLLFLNSQPPSIVMGLSALQQLPPQTAAFIAARQLTNYRAGFHVRHLVSSIPVLKAWLFAALKSCAPHFPIAPELVGPVDEAKSALDTHLTPASRDRLVELVSELLQSSPSIDLKDWVTGVDLTADRLGLVLANDLKSVTDILKTVEDPTSPPRERRLQELVIFAVSNPYFRVRQKLGLAVESTG